MVTVFICDDDPAYKATLKTFLLTIDDLEIVGEASNGQEALSLINQLRPDICFIGLTMPKMNGVELIKELQDAQSTTKRIVISQNSDEKWLDRLLAFEIDGHILKTDSRDNILNSITAIKVNDKYFSPSIAKIFYSALRKGRSPETIITDIPLTPKEKEVAILTSKGFTVREIAQHLNCSENTVKTHKSHLMKKIRAKNSAEVTSWVFLQK